MKSEYEELKKRIKLCKNNINRLKKSQSYIMKEASNEEKIFSKFLQEGDFEKAKDSENRLQAYRTSQATVQREMSSYQKELEELLEVWYASKEGNPVVIISDHAIRRYVERWLNLSIEEIKKKLLPEEVIEEYAHFGDGVYEIDGGNIRIVNGVVVTFVKTNKRRRF